MKNSSGPRGRARPHSATNGTNEVGEMKVRISGHRRPRIGLHAAQMGARAARPGQASGQVSKTTGVAMAAMVHKTTTRATQGERSHFQKAARQRADSGGFAFARRWSNSWTTNCATKARTAACDGGCGRARIEWCFGCCECEGRMTACGERRETAGGRRDGKGRLGWKAGRYMVEVEVEVEVGGGRAERVSAPC